MPAIMAPISGGNSIASGLPSAGTKAFWNTRRLIEPETCSAALAMKEPAIECPTRTTSERLFSRR